MKLADLSPDQILPPVVPAREGMDDEELRELTASIRSRGLIQPLTVVPEGDKYRLVAGHRRLLACQAAGLLAIPCVVKELTEEGQVAELIEENLHRAQLTPLEEGRAFAIAQEAYGHTIAQIAALIHKGEGYVASRLRLVNAPDDLQQAVRDQLVTFSVALELERCTNDEDRRFLLNHAISAGATSATVRRWVQEAALARRQAPAAAAVPAEVVIVAPPAVMMAACEWGNHSVPLNSTLSFRVCGDHYTFLRQLQAQIAQEAQGDGEGR